jgi:transcriptional regulator with XRE-family HTH domain
VNASVNLKARGNQGDVQGRTFAEALYRLRLAAGLSRLELADRVLCSENYIYRLESRDPRHRRVPRPWLVRALAEAMALDASQSEALLRARDRLDHDIVRGTQAQLLSTPNAPYVEAEPRSDSLSHKVRAEASMPQPARS